MRWIPVSRYFESAKIQAKSFEMDVTMRRRFWRLVAERIESGDIQALDRAIERLDRWRLQSGVTAADRYYMRWRALISAGVPAVIEQLRANGDDADTMRSCSPFLDVISQEEREALLKAVVRSEAR